ncbi:MAG: hypothetical protein SWH78_01790 [Thermodesulfobacteriota bacterium]|nr:hypothetical protein [Thermodesulfobacteriota bacterium]
MKCYLHIGTEKTGSTAIQRFLYLNRNVLARCGCLYTTSSGSASNRALPVAAYNSNRRDDFTQKQAIHDDQTLKMYQKSVVKALSQELAQLRTLFDVNCVVFSSEHIHSRLRTMEELDRLNRILRGLGFDLIVVIVYLREPADAATSLYSTAVKCGATDRRPPPPDNEYYRNLCDHRSTLLRYRDKFGPDAVVPRLYDRSEFINGSIIEDFMDAIGVDVPFAQCILPRRENPRLSATGLELLRRINERIPAFLDNGSVNDLRGEIASYVGRYVSSGVRYTMPPEVRREYEEAFANSNEWVRKEYFPERRRLFPTTYVSSSGQRQKGALGGHVTKLAERISAIWLDNAKATSELQLSRSYRLARRCSHAAQVVRRLTRRCTGPFRRP